MRGVLVCVAMVVGVVTAAAQTPPAKTPAPPAKSATGSPVQADAVVAAERDSLERRFRAAIERVDPAAAKAFDQGNAASNANRLDEAVAAYRRAIRLAPGVDHLHRRLCNVLAQLGRTDEALAQCETALRLAPDSPYDKLSVAQSLVLRNAPGDSARALRLAREGVDHLPSDPIALGVWCQVLLQTHQPAEQIGACADQLLAVDPNGLAANYVGALAAGMNGSLFVARQRLEKARAAGLGDKLYRQLLAAINRADAAPSGGLPVPSARILWVALWIVVAWVGLMGLLLVAGYVLSRAMLREVGRTSATAGEVGTGTTGERRLRKLYKFVLLVSGVYFYVSVPILLITIVAAGGGALYGFLAVGVIPVKLVLIIGIVVIATVGAIVRSVFVRGKQGSLGHRLALDREPRLRVLLEDVAGQVGTRPADAVYLTPGTDMAVTERAGLWSSLRGKRTERSLIMGVGLFEGMTQLQLRSVLAHEHGHFRNEDTAGGGFALTVRRSLQILIVRMARSGAASAFNPVWWFVRAYYRVYLGISQGASRLQEVLADRWAIQAYGTAGFVAGYRHVIERSARFNHELDATIKEVVDTKRPLPNLYQYRSESLDVSDAAVAADVDKQMTREPSAYDSHPSPRQRIAWAEALAVERAPQPGDDDSIWALFEEREELERTMTAEVRARLAARHGLKIAEREDGAGTG